MYILRKMKRTVRGVLAVFAGILLILTGTSCASDEADSAITTRHPDETAHDNYPIPWNERAGTGRITATSLMIDYHEPLGAIVELPNGEVNSATKLSIELYAYQPEESYTPEFSNQPPADTWRDKVEAAYATLPAGYGSVSEQGPHSQFGYYVHGNDLQQMEIDLLTYAYEQELTEPIRFKYSNERPIERPCMPDDECPFIGEEEVTLLRSDNLHYIAPRIESALAELLELRNDYSLHVNVISTWSDSTPSWTNCEMIDGVYDGVLVSDLPDRPDCQE